jgi:DNA-binding MarR family transcriptional regulator
MTYDKDMPPAPPTSSRPTDLAGELRVALTLAVRRIRVERSDDSISDGQYAVLAHLANRGPMTPSALAELERVQPPPMTRTVNCLAEAGLVRREAHPTDGRQVLVQLTDAGAAEVRETRRRRNAWLAGRLAELEPAERETLTRATEILRRITTT